MVFSQCLLSFLLFFYYFPAFSSIYTVYRLPITYSLNNRQRFLEMVSHFVKTMIWLWCTVCVPQGGELDCRSDHPTCSLVAHTRVLVCPLLLPCDGLTACQRMNYGLTTDLMHVSVTYTVPCQFVFLSHGIRFFFFNSDFNSWDSIDNPNNSGKDNSSKIFTPTHMNCIKSRGTECLVRWLSEVFTILAAVRNGFYWLFAQYWSKTLKWSALAVWSHSSSLPLLCGYTFRLSFNWRG